MIRFAAIGFFFALGTLLHADEPSSTDVFVPKADGFASIRIPSCVVSKKGTVLAFAEGRNANADQAQNRLILKRSLDGGKTWGPLAIMAEDGQKSLNNPTVVVERDSGQILVVYQTYPAGIAERDGKLETGIDGPRITRNFLITSDDDGVTWSKPRDITAQTKRPVGVTTIAAGPGIGIQLRHGPHAGRIVIPFNEGPFGLFQIYTAFSDDHGKTWSMGDVAPGALIDRPGKPRISLVNEAQLVERADGSILFNVRNWGGKPVRKSSESLDGGATWSKVEDVPDLRDPSCMASIYRYTDPLDHRKSRLLYTGPQSTTRRQGTIFLSLDEGKTWPVKKVINPGSFAYSCLASLDDGTILCLYETEGKVVIVRLTLDWLTDGADRWEPGLK